jgi:4-hydroxy-3-polyprenylbenzoate decarboxylase
MRIVIAGTGASGAIYLQRLLNALAIDGRHEVHLLLSAYGTQVAREELGELKVPNGVRQHNDKSMNVPFVSGSALFDAMVVIPCSMGTLGRIVAGTADSVILRSADVFLKESRKLILVPRETPWNLIHARNTVAAIEAGATIIPAMPSFYNRPTTIEEVADTVVHRVLDHLGLHSSEMKRWAENRIDTQNAE